jgi:hypothetical protein
MDAIDSPAVVAIDYSEHAERPARAAMAPAAPMHADIFRKLQSFARTLLFFCTTLVAKRT